MSLARSRFKLDGIFPDGNPYDNKRSSQIGIFARRLEECFGVTPPGHSVKSTHINCLMHANFKMI